MENFALIGSFDPAPLTDRLRKIGPDWKAVTARQDFAGSPHLHTLSIFLRWCADFSVGSALQDNETIEQPHLRALPEAAALIAWAESALCPKRLGRVLIVALKPGGVINAHADEGAYADAYERFHLVIASEPGNVFHAGTEHVHMQPGEMWWFDHKRSHWASNDSDAWRIHMILDAAVPKYRRERIAPVDNPHRLRA